MSKQTYKRTQGDETWTRFPFQGEAHTEFYRQLFENAVEAMLICDVDGVISHINRRATSLLGYSPDEIVTHSYTEIFLPVTKPLALQLLQQSVLTETAASWEAEIVRKDGRRVPVEVRIGALSR